MRVSILARPGSMLPAISGLADMLRYYPLRNPYNTGTTVFIIRLA
ncbi:hypothetical protein DDI_3180 [Dickeya dianthicola RNS04.9]|nr:hypothetical protein DDI_3180 [Dickeya dianthicola RNS04.9]